VSTQVFRESPYLSVVVPCYNGAPFIEASLGRLYGYLSDHAAIPGVPGILLVDDGSTDDTAERVANSFPEVRLLRHDRNRGKGAAVRTGVLAARGQFIFFLDADVPYDLKPLVRMLDYLDRKEFHACIGTRTRSDAAIHTPHSLARRAASWIFTEFVSRIVVTGVRDTQCGFKGFRREEARYLFGESRVDNFAFDVEVLYLAFKADLDVKRIPVQLTMDDYSSVSLWRHPLPMLLALLRLPIRYHTGGYRPYVPTVPQIQ
jgi:dolichyl-phosphate beta-glucosyltransferase